MSEGFSGSCWISKESGYDTISINKKNYSVRFRHLIYLSFPSVSAQKNTGMSGGGGQNTLDAIHRIFNKSIRHTCIEKFDPIASTTLGTPARSVRELSVFVVRQGAAILFAGRCGRAR